MTDSNNFDQKMEELLANMHGTPNAEASSDARQLAASLYDSHAAYTSAGFTSSESIALITAQTREVIRWNLENPQ